LLRLMCVQTLSDPFKLDRRDTMPPLCSNLIPPNLTECLILALVVPPIGMPLKSPHHRKQEIRQIRGETGASLHQFACG